MKFAILFAAAALSSAQQPASTLPAPNPPPGANPGLHADAVKLVELAGVRTAIQNTIAQTIGESKARMMQVCKDCTPEFADEWVKRMAARIKINDYVDVYVRVYEKYFNDDEIRQLIAIQNAARNSQPPTISDALKEKLTAQFPSVQSEIMGGTTQLGAKLGAEIGGEIQKEHPEYFKSASTQQE